MVDEQDGPEMAPIRLLICEDQTLMREGLHTVLELEPGFEVVGEAADGAEAVRLAEQLRPDIVLMDIQMPRQNGVQATAAITARDLPSRVIILTTFDYEDYVFDAIKAGAMGYLLKDTPAAELASTIRRVDAGEAFIQPKVATKLLMEFGRRAASDRRPAEHAGEGEGREGESLPEDLSQREVDVLRLLAQGASNREIAEQLVLAEGTVKNYVSNILLKLHAANRTQAANLARERGLI
ncbi:MAG TPA: response regulator transcription factor [Ktedonobacterales bacterium]|jgi:DNA-binding NarL/FixJ family response regulator|nr:response regulator transcription factor [Ktedonobacterales bacterium]